MKDMGMTDKQFSGYLRMLINRLEDVEKEADEKIKNQKLEKIISDLQKTIED